MLGGSMWRQRGFKMTMGDIVEWLSLYKYYDFGTVSPTVIKKEGGERSWAVLVQVFIE